MNVRQVSKLRALYNATCGTNWEHEQGTFETLDDLIEFISCSARGNPDGLTLNGIHADSDDGGKTVAWTGNGPYGAAHAEFIVTVREWMPQILAALERSLETVPAVRGVGTSLIPAAEPRPTVVCLCGSTRFADTFVAENLRLTLEGKIVLSIGANVSDASLGIAQDSDQKRRLDELHLRKIDLADEVLVLNVGGYIGESTRGEVEYARSIGKPVTYLEATP